MDGFGGYDHFRPISSLIVLLTTTEANVALRIAANLVRGGGGVELDNLCFFEKNKNRIILGKTTNHQTQKN